MQKTLAQLFELHAELAAFSPMEDHGFFYLKAQLAKKLRLFRLGYLADIFSKMDKVSLSVPGKPADTI